MPILFLLMLLKKYLICMTMYCINDSFSQPSSLLYCVVTLAFHSRISIAGETQHAVLAGFLPTWVTL